jgi:hypothetical protein
MTIPELYLAQPITAAALYPEVTPVVNLVAQRISMMISKCI